MKENALVTLNTLFPPSERQLPRGVQLKTLQLLRATYYDFLVQVETSGLQCFNEYVQKLQIPYTKYTWTRVRECVVDYITYSEIVMQMAEDIQPVVRSQDQSTYSRTSALSPLSDSLNDIDTVCTSRQHVSLDLSESNKASSHEMDLVPSNPISVQRETPIVGSNEPNNVKRNHIRPIMAQFQHKSKKGHRGNSSSEARKRVLQQQRVVSMSDRHITSDDVILPGTPFLPNAPEELKLPNFHPPRQSRTVDPSSSRSTHATQLHLLQQSDDAGPSGSEQSELKQKASFTRKLRNKLSIGSSSNSNTLRSSFKSQNGLGIYLDPFKSVENLPLGDSHSRSAEGSILTKHHSISNSNATICSNGSFPHQYDYPHSLGTIYSNANALLSEDLQPSTQGSNPAGQQIKKKRSLPAFFI